MASDRRQTALSVLGVVQYRKRLPRELIEESAPLADEGLSSLDANASESSAGAPIATSIASLKAVAEDLGSISDDVSAQASEQPKVVDTAASENTRKFDLKFWRCGNLLAVETAREDTQHVDVETRHRLVNNVFRVLYGNGASASLYTHSWPDMVAAERSDDLAAKNWLKLFLKGQQAKDPDTKLWLMGEDALDLLLSEHGNPSELEGMHIRDNTQSLDIFVSPALDQLVSKPYLKAGVWKLLRILVP